MSIEQELTRLASDLEISYLPKTAEAVRELIGYNFAAGHHREWHASVVVTYRQELQQSLNIIGEPDPEHHRELLAALDRLFLDPGADPAVVPRVLLESRVLIEAVADTYSNTRELYRSFIADDESNRHAYLNMCLMYLMLCEGMFRNQARFLLSLHRGNLELSTSAVTTTAASQQLHRQLVDAGLAAFANGYHRHVRNAIAHGHIKYVADNSTMRFQDFTHKDPGSPIFDEEWSFLKFAQLYSRLDDTYLALSTYLRVHFLPWSVRAYVKQVVH